LPRHFGWLSPSADATSASANLLNSLSSLDLEFILEKVVLTGFEPFGGLDSNPSWAAVQIAAERLRVDGYDVEAVLLPVVFDQAIAQISELIDQHRPEVFIAVGVAGSAKRIRLETNAVNEINAQIPDNSGAQPIGVEIMPGGPASYATTLPLSIGQAWDDAEVPWELSDDAGRYVCNATFYALQDKIFKMVSNARPSSIKSGFIHIPLANVVPIETSARAIQTAVAQACSAK